MKSPVNFVWGPLDNFREEVTFALGYKCVISNGIEPERKNHLNQMSQSHTYDEHAGKYSSHAERGQLLRKTRASGLRVQAPMCFTWCVHKKEATRRQGGGQAGTMPHTIQGDLSPTRRAVPKKTRDECWQVWEEKEVLVHDWLEWKMVQPLWKTGWMFLLHKNRTTIWPSRPTSGFAAKENEITVSKQYQHCRVHCSIIHRGQDMETTWVSSDGQIGKENVTSTQWNIAQP